LLILIANLEAMNCGGSGRYKSEHFANREPTSFAIQKAWRTWHKFLGQNRF